MGAGHSHLPAGHGPEPVAESSPETSRALVGARRKARLRASWILGSIVIPVGLIAALAMILLWPGAIPDSLHIQSPYAAAPGASIDTGTVQSVKQVPCPGGAQGKTCLQASTAPDGGGAQVPVQISPEISAKPGVHAGDKIRYVNLSKINQSNGADSSLSPSYVFMDFVRSVPLAILAAIYAVVVIAVARWKGLRAIVGLVAAFAVVALFLLPGLTLGKPAILLALVAAVVIMYVVVYFAHGVSTRTSTALIGTLFGLAIMAGLSAWAAAAIKLTGTSDDNSYVVSTLFHNVSYGDIVAAGLIISGLGVLNDVTITQSSAVWELYELAPRTPGRTLFASAMRIGRDHIASTVYTIAFAYAGGALPALMLLASYKMSLVDALTSPELAEEAVRTLVGSIGLVLAIPVTTAIAVLVVKATGVRGPSPAAEVSPSR